MTQLTERDLLNMLTHVPYINQERLTTMSDVVFLDTETLGVHLDSPIWEIAAMRRYTDKPVDRTAHLHIFVDHCYLPWFNDLPESFQKDYADRYRSEDSVPKSEAAELIMDFMRDRPHIVGAVPNFDTERIAHQILKPYGYENPWHYHLVDVENMAVGYLAARRELMPPPWKSDELSRAIGVDPDKYVRHTAMGDVEWVAAQYDAVMAGPK